MTPQEFDTANFKKGQLIKFGLASYPIAGIDFVKRQIKILTGESVRWVNLKDCIKIN